MMVVLNRLNYLIRAVVKGIYPLQNFTGEQDHLFYFLSIARNTADLAGTSILI